MRSADLPVSNRFRQPPEEFIKEQLLARIETERLFEEVRRPYRQRYFSDDCDFDSRKGTIQMITSETIEKVDTTAGSSVFVITRSSLVLEGYGEKRIRHRYHLEPSENSWKIHAVAMGCVAPPQNIAEDLVDVAKPLFSFPSFALFAAFAFQLFNRHTELSKKQRQPLKHLQSSEMRPEKPIAVHDFPRRQKPMLYSLAQTETSASRRTKPPEVKTTDEHR